MSRPNLDLHIDEIVLHGLPHLDQETFQVAVQQELARLFAQQGVPRSLTQTLAQGSAIPHLDGGSFDATPDTPGTSVGGQVARAVYGGLQR